jgi:hypothetical protein
VGGGPAAPGVGDGEKQDEARRGHPDTLARMANLAFTWKYSGHDSEAINLLRSCLAKQKQLLGLSHPINLSNSKTLLEWERETEWEWETKGQ